MSCEEEKHEDGFDDLQKYVNHPESEVTVRTGTPSLNKAISEQINLTKLSKHFTSI